MYRNVDTSSPYGAQGRTETHQMQKLQTRSQSSFIVYLYSCFTKTPLCVTVSSSDLPSSLVWTVINTLNLTYTVNIGNVSLRRFGSTAGHTMLREDLTLGENNIAADDNLMLTWKREGLKGGGGGCDSESQSPDGKTPTNCHAFKLYRNKNFLLEKLNLNGPILNDLVEEGAITLEDYYHIYQPGMPQNQQIVRLIDVLAVKNDTAYQIFLTAMKLHHPEIAAMLDVVEEQFQRLSVVPPSRTVSKGATSSLTSREATSDTSGHGVAVDMTSPTKLRMAKSPPGTLKGSETESKNVSKNTEPIERMDIDALLIYPPTAQTNVNQSESSFSNEQSMHTLHSSDDVPVTSCDTPASTMTKFGETEPQQSRDRPDSARALTFQSFQPSTSHAQLRAGQANDSATSPLSSVRPPPPPYRYVVQTLPPSSMSESPPKYETAVQHGLEVGKYRRQRENRSEHSVTGEFFKESQHTQMLECLPVYTVFSQAGKVGPTQTRKIQSRVHSTNENRRPSTPSCDWHEQDSPILEISPAPPSTWSHDNETATQQGEDISTPQSLPCPSSESVDPPTDYAYISERTGYRSAIADQTRHYPKTQTEIHHSYNNVANMCAYGNNPASSSIPDTTSPNRTSRSLPQIHRIDSREEFQNLQCAPLSSDFDDETLPNSSSPGVPKPQYHDIPRNNLGISLTSTTFPPALSTTSNESLQSRAFMVSCPEGSHTARERGTPKMGVSVIKSCSLRQSPEMMDTSSPQRVRTFEAHRLTTCTPLVRRRGRSPSRRAADRRQAQTPPPPKREPVTIRQRLAVTPPPTRTRSSYYRGYNLFSPLDEDASVKCNAEQYFRSLYTEEYGWMAQLSPRKHITDIFTDLKLVKREVHGRPGTVESYDMEEIFQRELCGSAARRTLVEGDSGVGKSTLCVKMVYDWATDALESPIKSKIPILVKARTINSSVKDAILDLFPSDYSEEFREEFWTYLQRQSDEFLLIFDGINELKDGIKTDLFELFGNRSLCKSAMLVTTQTHKYTSLYNASDAIVHVKGFTWYHTVDFIRKYFPRNFTIAAELTRRLGLPINAFEFNSMRSVHKQEYFLKLCISPLHISILCSIWEDLDTKIVPQKTSDLYRVLLLSTVRRLAIRENVILHADELEKIPQVYYEALIHLGQVSLMYVQRNETRLKKSDLKHNTNIVIQLGLLMREFGQYTVKRGMHFIPFHRSFLDFLAALSVYDTIRSNPMRDHSLSCRQLIRNAHCHQVCVFLLELLSQTNLTHHFFAAFRRIDALDTLFEFLHQNRSSEQFARLVAPLLPKSLTIHRQTWPKWKQHILSHLLRQDNASVKYLQIHDPLPYIVPEIWNAMQQNTSIVNFIIEELSLNTNPTEKVRLNLVAETLRTKWSLRLLKIQIKLNYSGSEDIFPIQSPAIEAVTVENLRILVESIRNSTIEHLYIFPCFGSKFSQMHMAVISEVLQQNNRLLSLNIGGHDHFCDSGIPALYQNGLKFNSKLQSLNLSFCNLGDDDPSWMSVCGPFLETMFYDYTGAAVIAHIIRRCVQLNQVNVPQCKLTPQGAHYLADAMKTSQSVTSLDLSYNSIGYVGITEIGHVLRVNTILNELNLNRIGFDEQSIMMFSDSLARNRGLKKLHLKECGVMGRALVVPLVNALCHKTDLELLDLSLNAIGDDGVVILMDVLQNSIQMRHLDLSVNKVSDISIQSLAQGLLAMPQLQALLLQLNDITSRGARVIASLLPRMSQLRRLDLEKNRIGDKGVTWVAKSLKNHPNLRMVNLCDNDIGNSGAKAMAEVLHTNTTITHLKLCGDVKQTNYIDNEGTWNISRALSTNRSLQYLDFTRQHIGNDGAMALANALEDNADSEVVINLNLNMAITEDCKQRLRKFYRNFNV